MTQAGNMKQECTAYVQFFSVPPTRMSAFKGAELLVDAMACEGEVGKKEGGRDVESPELILVRSCQGDALRGNSK